MKIWLKLGLLLTFSFSTGLTANEKYAFNTIGLEDTPLKSLSKNHMSILEKGIALELTITSEINGFDEENYLLQMQDKISLVGKQQTNTNSEIDGIQNNAIKLGTELIYLEKQLNNAFSNKSINEMKLDQYISEIMNIRAKLRLVHLSTQLQVPNILKQEEVILYSSLRAYDTSYKNPCLMTPQGQDIQTWKKYNGCK